MDKVALTTPLDMGRPSYILCFHDDLPHFRFVHRRANSLCLFPLPRLLRTGLFRRTGLLPFSSASSSVLIFLPLLLLSTGRPRYEYASSDHAATSSSSCPNPQAAVAAKCCGRPNCIQQPLPIRNVDERRGEEKGSPSASSSMR